MTYSCKPSSFGITPPWDSPPLPSPNEANVCTMCGLPAGGEPRDLKIRMIGRRVYALSQTSAGKERFAFGEQLRLRPLLSRVT